MTNDYSDDVIDNHICCLIGNAWHHHMLYMKDVHGKKVYKTYNRLKDSFFSDLRKLFKVKNNYILMSNSVLERACSIVKIKYSYHSDELIYFKKILKSHSYIYDNSIKIFVPCNHTILKIEKPKPLGCNDRCAWCLKVYELRLNKREGLKLSLKELDKLPKRRVKSLSYKMKLYHPFRKTKYMNYKMTKEKKRNLGYEEDNEFEELYDE